MATLIDLLEEETEPTDADLSELHYRLERGEFDLNTDDPDVIADLCDTVGPDHPDFWLADDDEGDEEEDGADRSPRLSPPSIAASY